MFSVPAYCFANARAREWGAGGLAEVCYISGKECSNDGLGIEDGPVRAFEVGRVDGYSYGYCQPHRSLGLVYRYSLHQP